MSIVFGIRMHVWLTYTLTFKWHEFNSIFGWLFWSAHLTHDEILRRCDIFRVGHLRWQAYTYCQSFTNWSISLGRSLGERIRASTTFSEFQSLWRMTRCAWCGHTNYSKYVECITNSTKIVRISEAGVQCFSNVHLVIMEMNILDYDRMLCSGKWTDLWPSKHYYRTQIPHYCIICMKEAGMYSLTLLSNFPLPLFYFFIFIKITEILSPYVRIPSVDVTDQNQQAPATHVLFRWMMDPTGDSTQVLFSYS